VTAIPQICQPRAFVVGEPAGWRERVASVLEAVPIPARAFSSGRAALDEWSPGVDLIVLAATSADLSGLAVCRRVRELPGGAATVIVLVSARDDEMERVLGFENGADDFVGEPFSERELVVRLRALLRRGRRSERPEAAEELAAGALRIDLRRGLVEVGGERVRLTPREFEVLRHLALHEGRVVARGALLEAVDGESHASERLIDTYVKSIRAKLGAARDLVETVRGVGYRLDAPRR
jgi:two-component system phosphate regulon response regulator PhoB